LLVHTSICINTCACTIRTCQFACFNVFSSHKSLPPLHDSPSTQDRQQGNAYLLLMAAVSTKFEIHAPFIEKELK
jgi:hypothetical protein